MYSKVTLCVKDSEGFIGNLGNFRDQHFIIRLDLLQDWIHDLNMEYALTVKLMEDDEKERRKVILTKNKVTKKATKK
jgi:hypothetical protein